ESSRLFSRSSFLKGSSTKLPFFDRWVRIIPSIKLKICGSSSVGRAIPCQGIGREFETLLPLQNLKSPGLRFGAFVFQICLRDGNPISVAEEICVSRTLP